MSAIKLWVSTCIQNTLLYIFTHATLLFFFFTRLHSVHFVRHRDPCYPFYQEGAKQQFNVVVPLKCLKFSFCKPKAKDRLCPDFIWIGKKDLVIPLKQGWLLIGGAVPHAGVTCSLLRPPQQSRILFHPGNCRANTRCSALQRWITYIVMVTYDAP